MIEVYENAIEKNEVKEKAEGNLFTIVGCFLGIVGFLVTKIKRKIMKNIESKAFKTIIKKI
ncbi:MAG: hypothetical protein ACFFCC_13070 [Promethearchaeota archaeon]